MKKHVGMFVLIIISGCANTPATEEDTAKKAIIHAAGLNGIVSVDGNPFVGLFSTAISPGRHRIVLGNATVDCNVFVGHQYDVSPSGCADKGLTEAARNVKNRLDAEQELRDKEKYQEYKQVLSSPQAEAYLRRMKSDIESKRSGFQNDPDNLLPVINQQLALYVEAEKKRKETEAAEAARQKAIRDKENARQQAIFEKELAAKEAAERKRIALFRDSLKEGDETNCGPAVEAKAKLVKVAFAVANYGTEHWIRRDTLFPPGYGCRFFNGVYQPPQ